MNTSANWKINFILHYNELHIYRIQPKKGHPQCNDTIPLIASTRVVTGLPVRMGQYAS
jgi:hypothetical protein